MEEMDSMQWPKIATEDLRQGGSLRVELKSPVFLTGKGGHHTRTQRQLGNITVKRLAVIYGASAVCSAKVTSCDLRNNLWGEY